MKSRIYWIPVLTPGRLAIMPRPRGGDWLEDEVASWAAAGVDILLSLLTPGEEAELDLSDEKPLCEAHGIRFLSFPIIDRSVPASKEAARKLVSELADELNEGKSIAVHCRQGIGRAALIAICVLVRTGFDPETATARVREARGCPVPETAEQERWIADFAKESPVLAGK